MESTTFGKSQKGILVIGCYKVLGKLDMTFEEFKFGFRWRADKRDTVHFKRASEYR